MTRLCNLEGGLLLVPCLYLEKGGVAAAETRPVGVTQILGNMGRHIDSNLHNYYIIIL